MSNNKTLESLVKFFRKTLDEYDEEISELIKKKEVINTRLKIATEQREKVSKLYKERRQELDSIK